MHAKVCVFVRFFVLLPVSFEEAESVKQTKIMADYVIEDEELGQVRVRVDARARRLIFRMGEDGIRVTVPPGTSAEQLRRSLRDLRPRLQEQQQKLARKLIDTGFRMDAELFGLRLLPGTDSRFLLRRQGREVEILCPPHTRFDDEQLQNWLRRVVVEAMRKRAQEVLPERLRQLSLRHGLPFTDVKINSSRGRWGSCSGRRSINLSCYLVLLPVRLIDYVLLHELSHTREMNHGDRFWALLNSLTGGHALELRNELKAYRTSF